MPRRLGRRVAWMLLALLAAAAPAWAANPIRATWHANPYDQSIAGYRFYFGEASRNTRPYDHYIDFNANKLCERSSSGSWRCAPAPYGMVSCAGLYGYEPVCTINDLPRPLYVSMTAYNAIAESAFTVEIYLPPAPDEGNGAPPPPGAGTPWPQDDDGQAASSAPVPQHVLQGLIQVYNVLLIKQDEESRW